MEYYTGKGRNGQDKKKKTCRETQHVKIDMERDASIIICRMVAVGENYNSTRDTWYFRNALVRANYNDLKNGIYATTKFLEVFFSNLLMGTDYELKN